jgi:hypothetical protein
LDSTANPSRLPPPGIKGDLLVELEDIKEGNVEDIDGEPVADMEDEPMMGEEVDVAMRLPLLAFT